MKERCLPDSKDSAVRVLLSLTGPGARNFLLQTVFLTAVGEGGGLEHGL